MMPLQVRCAIKERFPLKDAVDCTLKPMLRLYRQQLPGRQWRAVCSKAMGIIRHSIGAMQVRSVTVSAAAGVDRALPAPMSDPEY